MDKNIPTKRHYLIRVITWFALLFCSISAHLVASFGAPQFEGKLGIVAILIILSALPSLLPNKFRLVSIMPLIAIMSILCKVYAAIFADLIKSDFGISPYLTFLIFIITSATVVVGATLEVAIQNPKKVHYSRWRELRIIEAVENKLQRLTVLVRNGARQMRFDNIRLLIKVPLFLIYKYILYVLAFGIASILYVVHQSENQQRNLFVLGTLFAVWLMILLFRNEKDDKRRSARVTSCFLSDISDETLAPTISAQAHELFTWEQSLSELLDSSKRVKN